MSNSKGKPFWNELAVNYYESVRCFFLFLLEEKKTLYERTQHRKWPAWLMAAICSGNVNHNWIIDVNACIFVTINSRVTVFPSRRLLFAAVNSGRKNRPTIISNKLSGRPFVELDQNRLHSSPHSHICISDFFSFFLGDNPPIGPATRGETLCFTCVHQDGAIR